MSRAGREPAEDVKRRLRAACEEVGLTVTRARMHLMREMEARWVDVGASIPGWPHEVPTVSLLAFVKVSGERPEFVDIRCAGTNEDPSRVNSVWMRGRDRVPFHQLIEQLRETLEERELTISCAAAGIPGPYRFQRTVWQKVDLLGALDLF